MDIVWLTLEKTDIWMILMHNDKYQEKEVKYWDIFRRSIQGL
jgi:hypothetical protein